MSPDLLEEILVESRPAPDPAWAADLDRRVERGFERPHRPPWSARLRPLLLPAMGLATTCVLIVLVVSAGGGGDDASVSSDSAGGGSVAAERAPQADQAAKSGSTASS